MRTGYQGCVRAMRQAFREIRPDIVQGVGTEREGAISAVFSGFPNVVAIAGNMAELARLNRPRFGSYLWVTARLENFLLPRTGWRDLQLALFAKTDPAARQKDLADLSGSARPLSPAADPCRAAGWRAGDCRRHQSAQTPARTAGRGGGAPSPGMKFEFRFVGPTYDRQDPYVMAFLDRIRPMEAAGYARYLGTPSNAGMVECFDAASGMIHFPTEEAFGSVVAEGFARDLKFFGTRTGGIAEIADGAPGAELFEPDEWPGLTEAVARWIKEGHPCPAGASAIMRQRYHPEVYLRQHLQVYQEVLSDRE